MPRALLPQSQNGAPRPPSLRESRAALRSRLEARREEIEQAIAARVAALSEPREARDPAYAQGLRSALGIAIDYALEVIERGEERAPPVPPALLAQARLAARSRVALETVLRRYVSGYSLLGEFVIEAAEEERLISAAGLKRLSRGQAAVLDRLIAAVSEEHRREAGKRLGSSEERLAWRIERLLAGEPLDTSQLPYDFEACHLALIAKGPRAGEALRALASSLDVRLLLLRREEESAWAWLGARRAPESGKLRELAFCHEGELCLAIGEPGKGLAGWRQSHRQAKAAFGVALRGQERVVRYADVALLAAILEDDLLAASLRQLYLEPLERERDGGATLRETLRAYFDAGGNISSAAAGLGVNRHTVADRLRVAEERIGLPLDSCALDCRIALRLEEMDSFAPLQR